MTSFRLTVVSGPGDRVGTVLRGVNGPWSGAPTATTTGWLRCGGPKIESCQPIAGANAVDYTVVVADANNRLMLQVSASNAAGLTTVRSDPSPQILVGTPPPVDDGKPKWSNKFLTISTERAYAPGAVLFASSGSWIGATSAATTAWQSCDASGAACVNIAGQSQRTFTIIVEYVGRSIRYQETATNSAGSTTLTSAQTPVIVR